MRGGSHTTLATCGLADSQCNNAEHSMLPISGCLNPQPVVRDPQQSCRSSSLHCAFLCCFLCWCEMMSINPSLAQAIEAFPNGREAAWLKEIGNILVQNDILSVEHLI